MTIFAVWLGVQVNRANQQKRAVADIQEAHGEVIYDFQRDAKGRSLPRAEPAGPRWLRKLIGDEYFQTVTVVDFATEFYGRRKELGLSKVDDEGLFVFESLPYVEVIELGHNRAVTDHGIRHLEKLLKLTTLYLYDCGVTGTGLSKLAKLPSLEYLELRWSPVTHEGIVQIGQLQRLRYLGLADTPIEDDDLAALASLRRLEELRLSNTNVTDRGLAHLEGATGLRRLTLPTAISDDALARLQAALPNCRMNRVD